jgi:hypothetical protein
MLLLLLLLLLAEYSCTSSSQLSEATQAVASTTNRFKRVDHAMRAPLLPAPSMCTPQH